jgi:hypothetical protein
MAERMRLFDRYSNALLASLNNRISIRDTYGTRGGVVDSVTEKPQNELMGQPVAETEVRESKPHDRHVMVPFFSRFVRSRDCRYPLMPICYELKTLSSMVFKWKDDALNPTVINFSANTRRAYFARAGTRFLRYWLVK